VGGSECIIVLYRWGELGWHYVAGIRKNIIKGVAKYNFYNDGDNISSKNAVTVSDYVWKLWQKKYAERL